MDREFSLERANMPQAETEKQDYIFDFEEVIFDETKRLEFQQAVERSNGTIRVVVHPYHRQHSAFGDAEFLNPTIVEKTIGKIMNQKVKDVPILFLIEDDYFDQTKALLDHEAVQNASDNNHNFYLLRTQYSNPEPRLKGGNLTAEENWERLMDCLKNSGVRSIMLGGEYLMTPEHKKDRLETTTGCVNELNGKFKAYNIQTEISHLSFPASRNEIN